MIKVALIIVFVSLSKPDMVPEITVYDFYSKLSECEKELEDIKKNLNTEEIIVNNKKILKLSNREMYQEGTIYWSCNKKFASGE